MFIAAAGGNLPPVTDLAKAVGIELPPILGRVSSSTGTSDEERERLAKLQATHPPDQQT